MAQYLILPGRGPRQQQAARTALLVFLASACATHAAAPKSEQSVQRVTAVPSSKPSVTAQEPHATPPEPPAPLIVGNEDGLYRVSSKDGVPVLISPGPALYPRYLDADSVLVVHPARPAGVQFGAKLERVVLSDGTRTQLAKLPPFRCAAGKKGPAWVPDLDVQSPEGFRVAAGASRACLDLLDRNTNMASVSLDVEVDLRTGKVTRELSLGEPDCMAPANAKKRKGDSSPGCWQPKPAQPKPASQPTFPFAFVDHPAFAEAEDLAAARRAPAEGAHKVELAGYGIENASPSGRWLVVSGDEEDGDYIYRRLLLFDRQTGALYPVPEEAAAWPPALPSPDDKTQPSQRPVESAGLVEGEADLRWLGDPGSELLVVGRLVVRPGDSMFSIAGEIAR